jgi:hypothetical protein
MEAMLAGLIGGVIQVHNRMSSKSITPIPFPARISRVSSHGLRPM